MNIKIHTRILHENLELKKCKILDGLLTLPINYENKPLFYQTEKMQVLDYKNNTISLLASDNTFSQLDNSIINKTIEKISQSNIYNGKEDMLQYKSIVNYLDKEDNKKENEINKQILDSGLIILELNEHTKIYNSNRELVDIYNYENLLNNSEIKLIVEIKNIILDNYIFSVKIIVHQIKIYDDPDSMLILNQYSFIDDIKEDNKDLEDNEDILEF
jgi:hypothetical protein